MEDSWGKLCNNTQSKMDRKMCSNDMRDRRNSPNILLHFFALSHQTVKATFDDNGHSLLTDPDNIYNICWKNKCWNSIAHFIVRRKIGGGANTSCKETSTSSHECQQMGRRRWGRCQSKALSKIQVLNFYLLFFLVRSLVCLCGAGAVVI